MLQAVIKHSLVEIGYPASPVNAMIENAYKCSWPQGLATLRDETEVSDTVSTM